MIHRALFSAMTDSGINSAQIAAISNAHTRGIRFCTDSVSDSSEETGRKHGLSSQNISDEPARKKKRRDNDSLHKGGDAHQKSVACEKKEDDTKAPRKYAQKPQLGLGSIAGAIHDQHTQEYTQDMRVRLETHRLLFNRWLIRRRRIRNNDAVKKTEIKRTQLPSAADDGNRYACSTNCCNDCNEAEEEEDDDDDDCIIV